METNCIFITSNFVIHPQILIFSVFKIATCSPYWLQLKFSVSLFFYLFTFAINLWHRNFVTADVTAVFVNNQHDIQWQGQDFDNNFICNQYGERLAILNTENIKIWGWITKLEVIKMQFVSIFFHTCWISAENLNF